MNLNQTKQILDGKVEYRIEYFFSGFHGTRIVFSKLSDAKKASKLLNFDIRKHFKEYCLEFFN